MNSRNRRRSEADKHNYEHWLANKTAGQRRDVRKRPKVMFSAALEAVTAMAISPESY